jgi:hypothetical protein
MTDVRKRVFYRVAQTPISVAQMGDGKVIPDESHHRLQAYMG